MNHKTIEEIFKQRYSCKSFDPEKKISDHDFQFIIEMGILSPTSFGLEPYKMLVLQDKNLREKFLPHVWGAQTTLMDCSHFVVFLAGKAPIGDFNQEHIQHMLRDIKKLPDEVVRNYESIFNDHMKKKVSEKLNRMNLSEKHFQTVCDEMILEWSIQQIHIVLANMLTTATMMGINTCSVGGFYNIEKLEQLLKDYAKIDTQVYTIALMAAFGYEKAPNTLPKTRRSIDEVVRFV